VCYYNLGHFTDAERLFNAAIRHDPHQPVAFFNLGILSERREQFEAAQRFYHSALQSDPPEKMRTPLMEAIARVQQLTGSTPAPLPDGRK
jgi:Flp pilus assembly protein TadD